MLSDMGAKPTERSILSQICRRLRQRGVWYMKLHGSPMQRRGMPDLLVVFQGKAVFLEVKRPGAQPTPLQAHRLEELRAAGAVAEVVYGWDDVLKILLSMMTPCSASVVS